MVSRGKSDDGQTEKVQKQGTMKDLLNSLEDQIKPFFFHYLINKEHTKAYNKCRQDATETNSNKAMIQMDFSENFTCCYQDEVASTHWKTSSVTLYTVMIWFIDCSKSMVLLSDNNNDKTTVVPYTLHIIKAVWIYLEMRSKKLTFGLMGHPVNIKTNMSLHLLVSSSQKYFHLSKSVATTLLPVVVKEQSMELEGQSSI